MTNKSVINVKEWFFDKTNEAAKAYRMMLIGEYKEENGISMLDHTKLRVEEVLAETEKAYKVALDAETLGGNAKSWITWIPKSVIC